MNGQDLNNQQLGRPDEAMAQPVRSGQTQISDPSFPGAGVVFSTGTVVDQRAFTNHCGVPVAALIDLQPSQSSGLPQITARQPVRCDFCAAYLHPYCKVDLDKGLWQCPLCLRVSKLAQQQAGQEGQAQPETRTEGLPEELQCDAFEYIGQSTQPSASTSSAPSHVVLVVDATLDQGLLDNLRSAVIPALQTSVAPGTLVSVVAFDAVVAVASLEEAPLVQMATFAGSHAMDEASVLSLTQPSSGFWTPLGSVDSGDSSKQGWDLLTAALDAIRPLSTDVPVRTRPRCTAVAVEVALRLLAAAAREAHADTSKQQQGAGGVQPPYIPGPDSRILVFLGGPITKGPAFVPLELLDGAEKIGSKETRILEAAEEHMQALGGMASTLRVPIDIVLGGSSAAVNAPLLSVLTRASPGGEVWAHRGYGRLFGQALLSALGRRFGTAGVVDCRSTGALKLTQYLGPVDVLQPATAEGTPGSQEAAAAAAASLAERRLSQNACSISGSLCTGRGVAARFELTRDLSNDTEAVIVQIVVQYVDNEGRLVVRVVTRRLAVVRTAAQFVASINPRIAALVCVKRLAQEARRTGALASPGSLADARNAVGAALSLIASRCAREVQGRQGGGGLLGALIGGGGGGRKLRAWPAPLLPIAQALYHLAWGPILGPGPVGTDERLLLLTQLLAAGTSGAAALAFPSLYALMPVQQPATAGLGGAAAAGANGEATTAAGNGSTAGGAPHVTLALTPLPPLDLLAWAYLSGSKDVRPADSRLKMPPLLLDTGASIMYLPSPDEATQQDSIPATTAPAEVPAEVLWAAGNLVATRCPLPELHVVSPQSTSGVEGAGKAAGVGGTSIAPGLQDVLRNLVACHSDDWPYQAAQLGGLAAAMSEVAAAAAAAAQQQAAGRKPHSVSLPVHSNSFAAMLVGGEKGAARASDALQQLAEQTQAQRHKQQDGKAGQVQQPSLLSWCNSLGVQLLP